MVPDPRNAATSGNASPRRVVITGIGPITASGIGVDQFWAGLHGKQSPVGPVTRFDPSPFRTRIAAEVRDWAPEAFMDPAQARRLDRFGQFSIAAARMALDDAGLAPAAVDPDRVAVQMGSALGGIAHAERQLGQFLDRGIRGVDPRLALMVYCGASSCNVAMEFGFTGPNSTNAMSCASGSIAVGSAWGLVRNGEADVALAGGVEAPLAPLSYGAFAIIRAMSTRNEEPSRSCRPFDRGRDGFVMGEGGCVLILETEDHARSRGARVYAEVRGFGTTNDAYHMTAPRPDASQAARAIKAALQSAGVSPDAIDYVNAHGSSTRLNDSTESLAIRRALGGVADRIPVSGTKPFYGHALGASGAIESAICALALHHGWIPPTLNLDDPDDACDLHHVLGNGMAQPIRSALSNSFGFGGINASLVFTTYDGTSRERAP